MTNWRGHLRQPKPKNTGVHGGRIGCETEEDRAEWERYRVERRLGTRARVAGDCPETPKADEAAAFEAERDQAVNALEAALQRTPHGRRVLDLLAEAARWQLHEQLANELVASATQRVDALRHVLLTTGDALERHRAATQLPEAEAEFAKWQRALSDYGARRQYTEAAIRNEMRAFV